MSAADVGSLYFGSVPPPLRETMGRVGANVRVEEFLDGVVEAFRAVEAVAEDEVHARFRASRAYRDFVTMLGVVASAGMKILAIGCGRGLAGRSSAFAAEVVRENLKPAQIASLDRLDLTPQNTPETSGPYDLVVSHSLLHFIHDLRPVGRLVNQMLAPGGRYLMANEPNARFWQNPDCVGGMEHVGEAERRRKSLKKFVEPGRYWSRLWRLANPSGQCNFVQQMNVLLRQRFGLTRELTAKELVRILDPHLPDRYPGEFAIGSEGLSWGALEEGPLAGLHMDTARTSGYVMRDNPDLVPERWRDLDEKLAYEYPLDGCSFTAVWRK